MKSPLIAYLLAGSLPSGLALAQPSARTSARTTGTAPLVSPVIPSSPPPVFFPGADPVRSERTHQRNGREIVVRKMDPIPLYPPEPDGPRIAPTPSVISGGARKSQQPLPPILLQTWSFKPVRDAREEGGAR